MTNNKLITCDVGTPPTLHLYIPDTLHHHTLSTLLFKKQSNIKSRFSKCILQLIGKFDEVSKSSLFVVTVVGVRVKEREAKDGNNKRSSMKSQRDGGIVGEIVVGKFVEKGLICNNKGIESDL
jgi:hypothetical protein